MNNKQIVVGMSGGIDSCIALVLLKKQGWNPIGLSLKYGIWKNKKNLLRENICCTKESFQTAKNVCEKLNVPYYTFDVAENFKKQVIGYFLKELKENKTPNPCLICNRYIKFKHLFEWANKYKIKYIATGHYANIEKNRQTQKYELKKAKDQKKDQTYYLSFLPEEWLKYIIFPLGKYKKEQVYQIAKKEKFNHLFYLKESQDFCFVSGKSMNNFLSQEIGIKSGPIKLLPSKQTSSPPQVIGKHQGLHFYTIGQRKGIKLAGGPYFVSKKDANTNTLIVTKKNKELYKQKAILFPYYFISQKPLLKKIYVQVKIRYQQKLTNAILIPIFKNKIKIIFEYSQRAITPGQLTIFYQGNTCLGGGIIEK